ncbi:MAG: hypothetical protein ABJA16_06855 [Nakamurella sp.]
MNAWGQRRRMAGWLGLVGGILGVMVGLIQATIGGRMPEWTGNKADPTALGLLTMVLSSISVLSACGLLQRKTITPAWRLAAAIGLLVPGSLCFSTAGALWYLPGAILFTGGVYAIIAGGAARTRQVLSTAWLRSLTSVLGAFEVLMAVSAGPVVTVAVGTIGGLALMAAPWIGGSAVPIAALLIGTVPFALITWWSVATPVLALLALGFGLTSFRSAQRANRVAATPISDSDHATAAAAVALDRS